jgi:hypothetical protein
MTEKTGVGCGTHVSYLIDTASSPDTSSISFSEVEAYLYKCEPLLGQPSSCSLNRL